MKIQFPILNKSNQSLLVNLEVELVKGLPDFRILGVSSPIAQIMREKIRTAIKKSKFELKSTLRKIVNFTNLPQNFNDTLNSELQIVAMLMYQSGQIDLANFKNYLFLADLYLDGTLTTSYSASQILKLQQKLPNKTFVIESRPEFLQLNNVLFLNNLAELKNFINRIPTKNKKVIPQESVFNSITGGGFQKLALIYSLKNNLHTLLVGSTGVGKTMLFDTLPELGILEDQITYIDSSFTVRQLQEQIKSATGSKKTVYFILNELADFNRAVLDYLKIFFDHSSNIVVLATANPCPCGNRYAVDKICKCNPYQLRQYDKKLTLPLLDRFDLLVNLNDPEIKNMFYPDFTANEALNLLHRNINQNIELDVSAEYLLSLATEEFGFSKRRLAKIVRLAKLIAAYGGNPVVPDKAVSSALQYQNFIYSYAS
jgi:magnesium chelatase family protein